MIKNRKILELLHDTLLEKIWLENNNLYMLFSFSIAESDYNIKIENKIISNPSCIRYHRTGKETVSDILKLEELGCIYFKSEDNKVELFLDEDFNTFVELKYETSDIIITGEIEKLEEFWSHNEAA